MRAISWSELMILMVHGPDLPVRGRIRRVLAEGDDGGLGWIRVSGGPTPPPFAQGTEVQLWGRRVRLTDTEGRLTLVSDGTTAWTFDTRTPDEPPRETPLEEVELGLDGTDLLLRSTARDWLDVDTRKTPDPSPTTYAERAAWEVTLPAHRRRGTVQLVVDAETGRVLQRRDGRGEVAEWTELEVGVDLDPAGFTWDGPVRTWEEQLEDSEEEGERLQAEWEERTARWTREELGVTSLDLTVEIDVLVRHVADDGSMHASLGDLGMLERRRRSDEPWPEVEASDSDDGAGARWSDDRWDWAVRLHSARLSEDSLRSIREAVERAAPGL